VSVLTTLVDAGLFAFCTVLLPVGWALLLARWACGAIGAACNFALNRAWAFRAGGERIGRQAPRYALTALAAVSLATAIFALLRAASSWDPRLLHLGSLGLVWLAFTFPMMRRWVFRRRGAEADSAA
jgi:putative flippase GtrA